MQLGLRESIKLVRSVRLSALVALAACVVLGSASGCGAETESAPAAAETTAGASGRYDDGESNGRHQGGSYGGGYAGGSEDVSQEEWEAQEGEAWDDFSQGYLDGWESGCDIAFEASPDGSLYDQGDEYTAEDCYWLAPSDASAADVPYAAPYDPYHEGVSRGETDGCAAAFEELTTYGVLNWGEDSFDDSVCPY